MADPKLSELTTNGNFRAKVAATLEDVKGAGFPSTRIAEARRTVAQQRAKVNAGHSKTMKSEHLPGPDGLGRAADIVPKEGWGATQLYWLTLGRCALRHGLGWGGFFGMTAVRRERLRKLLTADTWDAKEVARQVKGGIGMGWDPAHVQQSRN